MHLLVCIFLCICNRVYICTFVSSQKLQSQLRSITVITFTLLFHFLSRLDVLLAQKEISRASKILSFCSLSLSSSVLFNPIYIFLCNYFLFLSAICAYFVFYIEKRKAHLRDGSEIRHALTKSQTKTRLFSRSTYLLSKAV